MMNFWQAVVFLLLTFHHGHVSAFAFHPAVTRSRSSASASALSVGEFLTSDLMTPFNATHTDKSSYGFHGHSSDDWSSEDDFEEDDDFPSLEFVSASSVDKPSDMEVLDNANMAYPFAGMLRNSAPYIADHSQQTAVFYVPGEFVDSPDVSALLGDVCLAWMLGLKIVIIVGCRFDNDGCSLDLDSLSP